MFRRYAASVCFLGLALLTPLAAQEPVEIHNWSAPPFWSLPKVEKPVSDSQPIGAEPFSTEGAEGLSPTLLPLDGVRLYSVAFEYTASQ